MGAMVVVMGAMVVGGVVRVLTVGSGGSSAGGGDGDGEKDFVLTWSFSLRCCTRLPKKRKIADSRARLLDVRLSSPKSLFTRRSLLSLEALVDHLGLHKKLVARSRGENWRHNLWFLFGYPRDSSRETLVGWGGAGERSRRWGEAGYDVTKLHFVLKGLQFRHLFQPNVRVEMS